MEKLQDLNEFIEEMELTVMDKEDAILLDGMVGTSNVNYVLCNANYKCPTNHSKCPT